MHDLHEDLINEDLYNKKSFVMVFDEYHGTRRSLLEW